MEIVFRDFVDGMMEVSKSLDKNNSINDESFDDWYEALINYYNSHRLESTNYNNKLNSDKYLDDTFLSWYGIIVIFAKDGKKFMNVLTKLQQDILSKNPQDNVALQICDTFYVISRYNGY